MNMARKFVIMVVIMATLTGVMHMLFIMFDYAFHNPTSGAMPAISDAFNDSGLLRPEYQNDSINQTRMFRDGFGIGRFVCIGLIPVCSIIIILTDKRSASGG